MGPNGVNSGLVKVNMKVSRLKTQKTIPPVTNMVRRKLISPIAYIIRGGIIAPPTLAPVSDSPNAHPKSFENQGESVALIEAAPIAGYAKPITP